MLLHAWILLIGKDDDRDFLGMAVVLQALEHRRAGFVSDGKIRDNGIRLLAQCQPIALRTCLSNHDPDVLGFKVSGQVLTDRLIGVDDEDSASLWHK